MIMDILTAIKYVLALPYFWNAMSVTTMMAMLFGGAIYDGEIPHAKKGLCAVCAYMFMVLLVTIGYALHRYPFVRHEVAFQLFVYPIQIVFLSIFWFVGFVTVIWAFRRIKIRKG